VQVLTKENRKMPKGMEELGREENILAAEG
jgi:hypothetical protein